MLSITVPATDSELNEVRNLMRGFVAWHMKRHSHDMELINRYFRFPGTVY